MKNKFPVIISILFVLLILGLISVIYFSSSRNTDNSNNDSKDDIVTTPPEEPINSGQRDLIENEFYLEQDGFELTGSYDGANWNYTIVGSLPNPCYSTDVEVLIAESLPEQVSINLSLERPSDDVVCVQMIEEFEYEGSFQASESIYISFNISR